MSKVNNFYLVISSMLVISSAVAQKDSSGIYKTSGDYNQRKLSYAINYKTEKHKINSDRLFNNADIKVKHDSKSYTLLRVKRMDTGVQKEKNSDL